MYLQYSVSHLLDLSFFFFLKSFLGLSIVPKKNLQGHLLYLDLQHGLTNVKTGLSVLRRRTNTT